MKKLILFAAMLVFAFTGTAFARGESYWIGSLDEPKADRLASNFSVRVDEKRMDVPVYIVKIKYKPGAINIPIMINNEDVKYGKPVKIIWKGCYNGFFEEKEMTFEGNSGYDRLTFTSSEAANRPDMFAVDGVVVWTKATGRENDKVCIVWDDTMNARMYFGVDFKEMTEAFNIDIDNIEGYKEIK